VDQDDRGTGDGVTTTQEIYESYERIPQEGGPYRCEYFALCDHDAMVLIPNPILGVVPTCDRCAQRIARMESGED